MNFSVTACRIFGQQTGCWQIWQQGRQCWGIFFQQLGSVLQWNSHHYWSWYREFSDLILCGLTGSFASGICCSQHITFPVLWLSCSLCDYPDMTHGYYMGKNEDINPENITLPGQTSTTGRQRWLTYEKRLQHWQDRWSPCRPWCNSLSMSAGGHLHPAAVAYFTIHIMSSVIVTLERTNPYLSWYSRVSGRVIWWFVFYWIGIVICIYRFWGISLYLGYFIVRAISKLATHQCTTDLWALSPHFVGFNPRITVRSVTQPSHAVS